MSFRRLAALVLLYGFMPGTGLLFENVDHLVQYGHWTHSAVCSQHPEDAPDHDEHGCTPTFHVCSCHPASIFLTPSTSDILTPKAAQVTSEVGALRSEEGAVEDVYRPPRTA